MTITTSRTDGDVIRGMALGVLGITLFGLTLPTTRIAVTELDPLFVTGARCVLAAVIAVSILVYFRRPIPPIHLWLRITLFSAAVVVGFPLFIALAMQSVPASHGGVVLAIMPLLTAIAGVIVAGERPSLGFWGCGVAGTLVVLVYSLWSGAGSTSFHIGDLLLAAAAISACSGYAVGGELSRIMPGWEVICWAVVVAAPPMLVLAIVGGTTWHASVPAWLSLAYTGLFSMLLGFFAWNRGLALGGIAKVGQVQLLQTFVTLTGSYLMLGERIGWLEIIFSVIVVGIVLASSRMRVRDRQGAGA